MAVSADDVLASARRLLQDESSVVQRYSSGEMLAALNEGQRAIVLMRHSANTKVVAFKLSGGARQSLPEDGVAFFRLLRNLGADGATPGRAITGTTVEYLDLADPDWYVAADATRVWQFAADDRDDLAFYVWPPKKDDYVELMYGAVPEEVTSEDDITLPDMWAAALADYIVYRMLAADTDNVANKERSENAYQHFVAQVSGKVHAEATEPAGVM
ncbi:MAG: DUF6682 family protein [Cellvibrionaceae bacterium]